MAQFALQISNFVEKTKDRQDIILRKVVLDLARGIVMKNPVDTGRSRASWRVGVNNVDPTVEPEDAAYSPSSAFQKVLNHARRMAQSIKAGNVIFITNNVEYITELEKGSSKQAPSGMIAVTLREYPGIVRKGVQAAKRERP